MNSKEFDVFNIHKPHLCQSHNLKLQLVCSNPECEENGLICIDCLLKNHKNCKENIYKYDEYLTYIQSTMENVQSQKEKRFKDAQQILYSLGNLQPKLNELILQIQFEIETFLLQEKKNHENEIMKKLFQANSIEETDIIKDLIQNQDKYFLSEEEYLWESQGIKLVQSLTDILNDVDMEFIKKQQILDSQKYIKIKGIEDLKDLTCFIPKLRLELFQNNWEGIKSIFPKFVALNSLQITAIKSPLKANNLEEIISAIQYLPKLEKFKINLIGSTANEQTLKLILKIVSQKKLTEFGISFGYSQILSDDFIKQINQFKEQLKGIPKIYISNQLHEFTQQQQKLLQQCLSQIEFFE
ncbi:unnamed protein product [Paramecium sonneborni]|uniref:Uncharacterized protein n=1 Tax=Paramecium sonneborni TaxID=65129 RepID=A0A8S1KFJ5_9CILI|nr:unnamed protein product [Paramecium sonneborni]